MVKLKHKIKAFTILESMAAMVIVMIVFGLTTMVLLNVTSSGVNNQKRNAHALVAQLRNETMLNRRFLDETFEVNEIRIEKQIKDYGDHDRLKELSIVAFSGKKKLIHTQELILTH